MASKTAKKMEYVLILSVKEGEGEDKPDELIPFTAGNDEKARKKARRILADKQTEGRRSSHVISTFYAIKDLLKRISMHYPR